MQPRSPGSTSDAPMAHTYAAASSATQMRNTLPSPSRTLSVRTCVTVQRCVAVRQVG